MALTNEPLRSAIGFPFSFKMGILAVVIVFSMMIFHPFCRYLCPLGAFYSMFNPIGFYRYRVDEDKCIRCGKCEKVCKMNINPCKSPNSLECIRCDDCKKACPEKAIIST